MSLSSISRALARSARSFRPRQVPLLEGCGGLRAPPRGGDGGGLGFARSYLTSALGSQAAANPGLGEVGDWRLLLASSQFRRLFSDGPNKKYDKYHPNEKEENSNGDGSDKSDSKKDSSSKDKWSIPEDALKKFQELQELLAPLLFLGLIRLMLSFVSYGSSAEEVPTLFVLAGIVYVYYTVVFLAIPAWLGLTTAAGVANAAAFTALAAACVATYAAAGSRDPGRVPAAFVPDVDDAGSPIQEIKRKGGDLRYCQKCSHYKPPRAHHCRVCKRCVLRMDHHCDLINNCIGHENYKIFIVLILYAVIASIYSMVLIIGGAMHSLRGFSRTSIIICGVLLCPFSLCLMALLGCYVYLILHNKTTIEWLAEEAGNLDHHPYDLGIYENLVSVLGPNMFCWLCPISRDIGNGVRFRTSYDIPRPSSGHRPEGRRPGAQA